MKNRQFDMKGAFTDLFNRVANEFDHYGGSFAYFGDQLVKKAEIREGARVLDVACGKGASLFPAADRAGTSGHVTGIDIAEEMVKLTSARIKTEGRQNADAFVMDAENLSFPDETFDNILCGFGIFFLPDCQKAMGELHRVLKPGGSVGFATFLRKDFEEFAGIKAIQQKHIPPDPVPPSQTAVPVFDTEEGMTDILAQAGFGDIRTSLEEKEFLLQDAEEWWGRQWSQGSRLRLERLSPERLECYRKEAFEELNRIRKADGIHYRIAGLFSFGTK